VFFGGYFEYLIRILLVRSLEPKLRKAGTGVKSRKFSDSADRSLRIIKGRGMKLLTGFRRMSLPVGRTEIRCEKETGSPCEFRDARLKSCTTTWRANGVLLKRRLLQMFLETIQLSSLQRKWNVKESTLRRQKIQNNGMVSTKVEVGSEEFFSRLNNVLASTAFKSGQFSVGCQPFAK